MKTLFIVLFSIILFSCTKENEINMLPSISVTYDSTSPYNDNERTFIANVKNVDGVDSIIYIWVVNSVDTTWTNMRTVSFLPKTNVNKYVVECTAIIYDKSPYFYKLTLYSYTILYIQ
jgi:hypothetical protein